MGSRLSRFGVAPREEVVNARFAGEAEVDALHLGPDANGVVGEVPVGSPLRVKSGSVAGATSRPSARAEGPLDHSGDARALVGVDVDPEDEDGWSNLTKPMEYAAVAFAHGRGASSSSRSWALGVKLRLSN